MFRWINIFTNNNRKTLAAHRNTSAPGVQGDAMWAVIIDSYASVYWAKGQASALHGYTHSLHPTVVRLFNTRTATTCGCTLCIFEYKSRKVITCKNLLFWGHNIPAISIEGAGMAPRTTCSGKISLTPSVMMTVRTLTLMSVMNITVMLLVMSRYCSYWTSLMMSLTLRIFE